MNMSLVRIQSHEHSSYIVFFISFPETAVTKREINSTVPSFSLIT